MTPREIASLIQPYVPVPPAGVDWLNLCGQLEKYLHLILKWNARTNLTAIRSPEEIVRRHFGESLFAGMHLVKCKTLLDFGSGAGFPGIPIQIIHPEIQITLAESQGKKAAFLSEVVRSLNLKTEVWTKRVEQLPIARHFDTVTLRAVDNMESAIQEGARRADHLVILTTSTIALPNLADFVLAQSVPLPDSSRAVLQILERS